jgi:hypothetical protein
MISLQEYPQQFIDPVRNTDASHVTARGLQFACVVDAQSRRALSGRRHIDECARVVRLALRRCIFLRGIVADAN